MFDHYENNVMKSKNNSVKNQSKINVIKNQKTQKIIKRTKFLLKKKTIREFCDVF